MHDFVRNRNTEVCAICGYIATTICVFCRKCSVCTRENSRESQQVIHLLG